MWIVQPEATKTYTDHNVNRRRQINQPTFDGRRDWQAEMVESEKQRLNLSPAQRRWRN